MVNWFRDELDRVLAEMLEPGVDQYYDTGDLNQLVKDVRAHLEHEATAYNTAHRELRDLVSELRTNQNWQRAGIIYNLYDYSGGAYANLRTAWEFYNNLKDYPNSLDVSEVTHLSKMIKSVLRYLDKGWHHIAGFRNAILFPDSSRERAYGIGGGHWMPPHADAETVQRIRQAVQNYYTEGMQFWWAAKSAMHQLQVYVTKERKKQPRPEIKHLNAAGHPDFEPNRE